MEIQQTDEIEQHLVDLKLEHRDLDQVIGQLESMTHVDELQITRLKKRKLHLKDHIFQLERQLVPDIPA